MAQAVIATEDAEKENKLIYTSGLPTLNHLGRNRNLK
jgi:hypothetical protein